MVDDRVRLGMVVYDVDGRRLGKVVRCDPWAFEVKRGLWGPRTWVVGWHEVIEAARGRVRVARSDRTLFELAAGEYPHAWRASDGAQRPPGDAR